MEWWQIQELIITLAVIAAVLVPVFGLTYRFLGKTASTKRLPGGPETADAEFRHERLDQLERQLEDLTRAVGRLVDGVEFDRQLKSGASPDAGDA